MPNILVLGNSFNTNTQGDAITILGGYEVLPYLSVEGRYSRTLGDLSIDVSNPDVDFGAAYDATISNFGLYLKPNYTSGVVTLYGLLGVGHIEINDDFDHSDETFQWGAGISFNVGDSIFNTSDTAFFIDYIRFDEEDGNVFDSVNAGLSFKF